MDFKILLEKITPSLKYVARKHLLRGFYSEEDLFQEMCLYLWQHYGQGLPIGINESYVIKGCEFHLQNFLRKGRPKVALTSLDELITPGGSQTLADILEDKKAVSSSGIENKLTVDEIMKIGLTADEKAVLTHLLKGSTMREIAKEMEISHVMVLKHKKNIIKKWRSKACPVPKLF
ncbi:MAG: sigma-70 family RNA polymerase sigma factor [Candidatus Omnitrophota bacterium]|nr:sigma-70 family RNA polymerase sigma factor [Candidatus Omnitrophota bacterium]